MLYRYFYLCQECHGEICSNRRCNYKFYFFDSMVPQKSYNLLYLISFALIPLSGAIHSRCWHNAIIFFCHFLCNRHTAFPSYSHCMEKQNDWIWFISCCFKYHTSTFCLFFIYILSSILQQHFLPASQYPDVLCDILSDVFLLPEMPVSQRVRIQPGALSLACSPEKRNGFHAHKWHNPICMCVNVLSYAASYGGYILQTTPWLPWSL